MTVRVPDNPTLPPHLSAGVSFSEFVRFCQGLSDACPQAQACQFTRQFNGQVPDKPQALVLLLAGGRSDLLWARIQLIWVLLKPTERYSIFWTCSRICSINTLSSTPQRVTSTSLDFEARVLASRLSSCIRKSSLRPMGSFLWSTLSTSSR